MPKQSQSRDETEIQRREERPAAFRKKHKEGHKTKLNRKGTALAQACPCGRHSSSAKTLLRATCLRLDSSSGPRGGNASESPRLPASRSRVSPRSRSRSISRPRSS